jgi:hypothetical protein
MALYPLNRPNFYGKAPNRHGRTITSPKLTMKPFAFKRSLPPQAKYANPTLENFEGLCVYYSRIFVAGKN